MARFETALALDLLKDATGGARAIWRLEKPLIYSSEVAGQITVPRGFVTDLASVPRTFLTWLIAGGLANAIAVVLDYLFAVRFGTRARADRILYEGTGIRQRAPIELEPLEWWRRNAIYYAVRLGGQRAWEADTRITEQALLQRLGYLKGEQP